MTFNRVMSHLTACAAAVALGTWGVGSPHASVQTACVLAVFALALSETWSWQNHGQRDEGDERPMRRSDEPGPPPPPGGGAADAPIADSSDEGYMQLS